MNVSPTNFIPPLVVTFVVWSIYLRVRRSIGRQPLQPKRLILRIVIFSLVSILVALTGLGDLRVMLGFAGGLLSGVLLAFLGLRLTRFETTAEGKFYTPSTHIGIALSLLLVGRLAYRLPLLLGFSSGAAETTPGLGKSPLTLGVFGLLAGYYIVYFIGVLLHSRDVN